jgi:hypothetical protein
MIVDVGVRVTGDSVAEPFSSMEDEEEVLDEVD